MKHTRRRSCAESLGWEVLRSSDFDVVPSAPPTERKEAGPRARGALDSLRTPT
jgi:hypothetical protein